MSRNLMKGRNTYLKCTTKRIQQDGKEKKSTPGIETGGGLREIVEDRTDDQGHNGVSEKLRKGQSWISLQSPETSSKAELHLSNVG
jgi:hypothetical protein